MTDRTEGGTPHISEEELMRRLEAWEAQLEKPPTIWEVVQHGDGRIAAAYITRNFRIAAKEAVRSHERAQKLRGIAVAFFADAEMLNGFSVRHSCS